MGLKGYTRQAGPRDGGVTRIALARAVEVRSVRYDRATGNAESIELVEGGSFALYRFREDSARFIEKTTMEGGLTLVDREITFLLERLDENERETVSELIRTSPEGLVAVVYNGCGAAHLVGVSRHLGLGMPLRLKTSVTDPGLSPEDLSGETLTLKNQDTAKAPLFTGELKIHDA